MTEEHKNEYLRILNNDLEYFKRRLGYKLTREEQEDTLGALAITRDTISMVTFL